MSSLPSYLHVFSTSFSFNSLLPSLFQNIVLRLQIFSCNTASKLFKKTALKKVSNADDSDRVDSRPRNNMSTNIGLVSLRTKVPLKQLLIKFMTRNVNIPIFMIRNHILRHQVRVKVDLFLSRLIKTLQNWHRLRQRRRLRL